MSGAAIIRRLRGFLRREHGAVMIEFAIIVMLFFFMFFSLLDFGRLGSSIAMTEKAAQIAARIAIVRPPACPGVPETHARGNATVKERMGTSCRVNNGSGSTCANPGTPPCAGDGTNPTALEIWNRIEPLLPPGTQITNLQFRYDFDSNLGFLGGPYTPMVTVTITPADFQFVSPLSAMAAQLGVTGANNLSSDRPYRGFSVSMPAEDLALGTDG